MTGKLASESNLPLNTGSERPVSHIHKLLAPIRLVLKKFALALLAEELQQSEHDYKFQIDIAVETEARKVSVIIDHMQQAFFSVGAAGVIVDPVTKYTEKVFGRCITGENVMNTLYTQLKSKPEIYEAVQSALLAAFGENELQWDLVEANFPRKIEYFPRSADTNSAVPKLLKVSISPIWDAEENLERLLFVVEDITNLEKLETQFKQEQEQTAMIECVLENPIEELTTSIKKFYVTLKECRRTSSNLDPMSFMDLLRNLHTLKGHARQLKMRVLSDQVHQSEQIILDKMSEVIHADDSKPVIDEIDKIENVLDAHSMLIQKFLRSDVSTVEGAMPMHPLAFNQSWELVESIKNKVPQEIFNLLELAWTRIEFKSLACLATKYAPMISDISSQLGKKVDLQISSDALVSSEQALALQECLLHLVRNSIDHGIESSDVRAQLGKTEKGHIRIEFVDNLNSFTIIYSDDGQGVDSERVAKKALKNNLITAGQCEFLTTQDKINLILLPHFSTKDVATEISGRGFGLDVVKEAVGRLGGTIHLTSEINCGLKITIRMTHKEKIALRQVA